MDKVSPFLWFDKQAEEAAKLYVSLIPNSRIDFVTTMPGDSPSGPEGSVKVVEFTLGGRSYTAMDAGPYEPFTHAVSFQIDCDDQAEVDRLWDALLANGGSAEQCGWLKDRFGVSWQIVPKALTEMMRNPDRVRGRRVVEAMMKMVKLDIIKLQSAFRGDA